MLMRGEWQNRLSHLLEKKELLLFIVLWESYCFGCLGFETSKHGHLLLLTRHERFALIHHLVIRYRSGGNRETCNLPSSFWYLHITNETNSRMTQRKPIKKRYSMKYWVLSITDSNNSLTLRTSTGLVFVDNDVLWPDWLPLAPGEIPSNASTAESSTWRIHTIAVRNSLLKQVLSWNVSQRTSSKAGSSIWLRGELGPGVSTNNGAPSGCASSLENSDWISFLKFDFSS